MKMPPPEGDWGVQYWNDWYVISAVEISFSESDICEGIGPLLWIMQHKLETLG